MISRLTVILSLVVILLSGSIVYYIYEIQTSAKQYVPQPIVNSSPTNSIKSKEQAKSATSSYNTTSKSNNSNTDTNSQQPDEKSQIQKYNLSKEELYNLLSSGNPFGTSLSKNSTSLKAAIDKQVQDTQSITKQTNATSSTTQTLNAQSITEDDINQIAELKAKKYNIPSSWITAIIQTLSNYKGDLTTKTNGVTREGIMQIREDKIAFISESIGAYYDPNKIQTDIETNIEMGAYYLSYLAKQNSNKDYIFSAYYLGPTGAKKQLAATGTYKTDFSTSILTKIKES